MNEASVVAPQTAGAVLNDSNKVAAPEQKSAQSIVSQPTSQLPAWYSDIKDEGLRGYAETKNFTNSEELLSAYKSLDEMGIAERAGNVIQKPDAEDQESMNNFYKAIGRPDSPDAYKLLPEGQAPTEFTKEISKVMFENGLTNKQVESLASRYNDLLINSQKEQQRQFEVNSSNEMEALKNEWGAEYGRNVEMFRRGVKGLGVSNEEFANIEKSIGTKRSVEIFKNAASGLTESQYRASGDTNNAYLSPEGAKAEIERLSFDKGFADKLLKNDVSSLDKWERLNRLAMESTHG